MARRVEWTETAIEDVEHVADFIARDSPRYAASLVRDVLSRAASLAELAERGRIVPELSREDVRELLVSGYRMVYSVAPDVVTVLGLIHGARDFRRLWDRDDRPDSSEG